MPQAKYLPGWRKSWVMQQQGGKEKTKGPKLQNSPPHPPQQTLFYFGFKVSRHPHGLICLCTSKTIWSCVAHEDHCPPLRDGFSVMGGLWGFLEFPPTVRESRHTDSHMSRAEHLPKRLPAQHSASWTIPCSPTSAHPSPRRQATKHTALLLQKGKQTDFPLQGLRRLPVSLSGLSTGAWILPLLHSYSD